MPLTGTPLWALGGAALGSSMTSYHIGNSLTQCADPRSIRAMGQRLGYDHRVGTHIVGSATLPDLVALSSASEDPPTPYGEWPNALARYQWDFVTIQTQGPSTMLDDETAALALIDYAGDNVTEWLLHAPWPPSADLAAWLDAVVDADGTAWVPQKAYHDHLLARLQAARPARTISLLETGEVIVALNTAGVAALYVDALHLSYGYSRFAVTLAAVARMLGLATTTGMEHAPYEQAVTDPVLAATYAAIWTAVNDEIIGP